MHIIQKILLKRLSIQNEERYSELTKGYNFEDNIVFHLKQLIDNQFILKNESVYSITAKGLKEIYSYELSDLSSPGIKTFFYGFIICDEQDNFLIKSHPTAKDNFYNLPSGRPVFGKNTDNELTRLFKENTGIIIDPKRFEFKTIHSKIVKTKNEEVLFDDGQAIFKITITDQEKSTMELMKDVNWYSKNSLSLLDNCWPEIGMCILEEITSSFVSYEIISNYKL